MRRSQEADQTGLDLGLPAVFYGNGAAANNKNTKSYAVRICSPGGALNCDYSL